MKKAVALLALICILFSFSSCKTGEEEKYSEELEEAISQVEELTSQKDTSVLEGLKDEQNNFMDSLGVSAIDKKIVAYIDAVNYTMVYSCELTDKVISKVTTYHIVKNDAYFNVLKAGITAQSKSEVNEENKIISSDKTDEYKGLTYNEMLNKLTNYTVVME